MTAINPSNKSVSLKVDASGALVTSGSISGSLPSGSNVIGQVVSFASLSTGFGAILSNHLLQSSAASTNAVVIKGSTGKIAKIRGINTVAQARFLKLYNKATTPIVGTDTPLVTIALKANDVFDFSIDDLGLHFSAGIAYALTTLPLTSDTTAVASGDIQAMNILFV